MNILVILVPVSLVLAILALAGVIWTIRRGQYEDLKGDSERVLLPDAEVDPES